MPSRSPVQLAFARTYAHWGLHIPDAVAAARTDGYLSGGGWTVRWRWHADGALEYRASHRMTDERWELLAADGTESSLEVPFSAWIAPPDADDEERARIKARYHADWKAHGIRVQARGMAFSKGTGEVAPEHRAAGRMLWRVDGEPWTSSPLLETS